MKNYSLFIVGIMMLVFAGMWHLFRHGRSMEKAPPPKPVIPPSPLKAKSPPPLTSTSKPTLVQSGESIKPTPSSSQKEEKPITAQPPTKGATVTSQSTGQVQEQEKG